MKKRAALFASMGGFCVLLAGTIAGCDQADQKEGWVALPAVVDESLPGIYQGTFTDTSGAHPVSYDVVGMVDPYQNVQLMFPLNAGRHMAGVLSVDESTLTGTLTEYIGAEARFMGIAGIGAVSLDGSASTAEWLFGDYVAANDHGRFTLDYQQSYERGSSPEHTAGVWRFEMASSGGGVYAVSWDIDHGGLIIGTDTYGCIYDGNISSINPAFNLHRVNIDVTACHPFNGRFGGLAFLQAVNGAELNWMTLSISNDVYAFATAFQKQP